MKFETKLVVGWLEVELMRALRYFVVGVVRGGSLGYDLQQSCGLRGHVWLILLSWIKKCLNMLRANPSPLEVFSETV